MYYLNASQALVQLNDGTTVPPGTWVVKPPEAVAGLPAMRPGFPRRSARKGLDMIAPTPSPLPEPPSEPVPAPVEFKKHRREVKAEAQNG